jgi:hypothetical protein
VTGPSSPFSFLFLPLTPEVFFPFSFSLLPYNSFLLYTEKHTRQPFRSPLLALRPHQIHAPPFPVIATSPHRRGFAWSSLTSPFLVLPWDIIGYYLSFFLSSRVGRVPGWACAFAFLAVILPCSNCLCALVHGYHSVSVRRSFGPMHVFLGRLCSFYMILVRGIIVITYPSYCLVGGVVSVPSDNVLIICLIIWFSLALCLAWWLLSDAYLICAPFCMNVLICCCVIPCLLVLVLYWVMIPAGISCCCCP